LARLAPGRRSVPRLRAALVVVVALVFAAALAGCGSGKSTSSPTTTVAELDSPTEGVEVIASSLQLQLLDLGYEPGPVNGQFTPATQAALRKFQTAHDVPAPERGALGPGTAAALARGPGGSSNAVQALQSALTDVGLFNGAINGDYGAGTLAAVEALQRKTHITTDGFYGPDTAAALTRLYQKDVPQPPSTTVPTTTPATTPTSGPPASGPPPSTVPDEFLKLGSEGPDVTHLQERLTQLGYRPGAEDGVFGASTASAVLAFQKRNGLPRDGVVGPQVETALAHPTGAGPRSGLPVPRVEVDIARQIAFVVLPSQPVITLNVSTGNGETYTVPGGGKDVAYTPVGTFSVERKVAGDERAPLGTLHNPMYFYRGWAIHGSPSVPAYPASHGCVRISNADADWLFPLVPIGTPVVLYDTTGKSPEVDHAPANAAPGD
jgi:peptidoglycan hydrolase-like protein with peptidoglycan-binding domain